MGVLGAGGPLAPPPGGGFAPITLGAGFTPGATRLFGGAPWACKRAAIRPPVSRSSDRDSLLSGVAAPANRRGVFDC